MHNFILYITNTECVGGTLFAGGVGVVPQKSLKIVDSIYRNLVRFTPKIISIFLCFSLGLEWSAMTTIMFWFN